MGGTRIFEVGRAARYKLYPDWRKGSGTRTNKKVEAHLRRKAPEIFFLVVPLQFFGSTSTISNIIITIIIIIIRNFIAP